MVFQHIAAA